MGLSSTLLLRSSKKTFKTLPQKNFLYFGKWNFLPLILKNLSKRKSRNGNPIKFLIFRNIYFLTFPERTFWQKYRKKIIIFSEKKAFLILSETKSCPFSVQASKLKEIHRRKIYYTSRNGSP